MIWTAKWIKPAVDTKEVVPVFSKRIILSKEVEKATLSITCMGVYEASIIIAVGYENQSYFYRQFKERYGMTPRDYRVKYQNGK